MKGVKIIDEEESMLSFCCTHGDAILNIHRYKLGGILVSSIQALLQRGIRDWMHSDRENR